MKHVFIISGMKQSDKPRGTLTRGRDISTTEYIAKIVKETCKLTFVKRSDDDDDFHFYPGSLFKSLGICFCNLIFFFDLWNVDMFH